MKLELAQALILQISQRWEDQYPRDKYAGTDKAAIGDKLIAAGPTATSAEIAAIIGNKSWSYFTCAECDQYVERGVSISRDYEPLTICVSCCRALAALASVDLGTIR